jgi:hypothetical protein
VDGTGQPARLTTSEDLHVAAAWSHDGLLFVEVPAATRNDIWLLPTGGDQPKPIIRTNFSEGYPDLSPDGRWLAYASDESGRNEVYVQPFPGPGPRQQVSTNLGTGPAWSRDGKELFYTTTQTEGGQATSTTMMSVPIELRPTFKFGVPRVLFRGNFGASALIRSYDVTADGRQFLMVQQKERPPVSASEMILVLNWSEELKARLPAK